MQKIRTTTTTTEYTYDKAGKGRVKRVTVTVVETEQVYPYGQQFWWQYQPTTTNGLTTYTTNSTYGYPATRSATEN